MTSPAGSRAFLASGRRLRDAILFVTLAHVVSLVRTLNESNKVVRSVIQGIAIDVVHVFIWAKTAAVGLLPNKAVFGNPAILLDSRIVGQVEQAIPVGVDPARLMCSLLAWRPRATGFRRVESAVPAVTRNSTRERWRNPCAAPTSAGRALIGYADKTLAKTQALVEAPPLGMIRLEPDVAPRFFMPGLRNDVLTTTTGAFHVSSIPH